MRLCIKKGALNMTQVPLQLLIIQFHHLHLFLRTHQGLR
jgi:hypothetical protein